jgi:putative membrane protein (TIGR04086 family)
MFNRRSLLAIGYGVGTILFIIILSSFVLSLVLKFTDVDETSLTWLILTISAVALFIGGFISGGKGQERGWLIGALTGAAFTLLVYLVQFLGFQASFSVKQTLLYFLYILISVLGGIIGVNVAGRRATQR